MPSSEQPSLLVKVGIVISYLIGILCLVLVAEVWVAIFYFEHWLTHLTK